MDLAPKLEVDGIHLTEIDGVPVAWIEHSGDHSAVLSFRVGQADESLPARGLTHLVEHAALSQFSTATFDFNGSTGATVTRFMASARPETIADFITRVCDRLGQLGAPGLSDDDVALVRHDAKILRAESNTRGNSIITAVLADLYGATGHGLTDWDELSLIDLRIDRFQEWLRSYFTSGNAVLTLTFPPPPNLRLAGLTAGQAMPAPSVAPLLDELPVHRRRSGPFGLVAPVTRGTPAVAFTTIYERVLQTRLRHEGGTSYAPSTSYTPVSLRDAFVMATADSLDGHGTSTTIGALDALDRLATDGPSIDELTVHRDRSIHAMSSEVASRQQLAYVGDELLYGHLAPLTRAEQLARLEELTSAEVAEVASRVRKSMAVSIPIDADISNVDLAAYPEWPSRPPVNGTSQIALPQPGTPERNRYITSDEGVTLIASEGREITVLDGEAVALLRWDDDVDQLVGRDGSAIRLVPSRWPDPDTIRLHFEKLVDEESVLHMGFRAVAPDLDPVPKGMGVLLGGWIVAAVMAVVGAIALIGAPSSDRLAYGVAAVLSAGIAVALHRAWYDRLRTRQLYDDMDWHVTDHRWRPDLPIGQAYMVGALKLAWLADRDLLAPWVERAASEHLAAYRAREMTAIDLYRELNGLLASDMCAPSAAAYFTWLTTHRIWGNPWAIDEWWRAMGFGMGSPYDRQLDEKLLERSHTWFDKRARQFRILSLRRLAPQAPLPPGVDSGAEGK